MAVPELTPNPDPPGNFAEDILDPAEHLELDQSLLPHLSDIHIVSDTPDPYLLSWLLARLAANSKGTIDTSDVPHIDRLNTVKALYAKCQKYRFVQVRGPPGSGKTYLAKLLADYVRGQEPSEIVVYVDQWREPNSRKSWRDWLQLHVNWWDWGSFLIIDDAQNTYHDKFFWNTYMKDLNIGSKDRVIIFSSYASPRVAPPDLESWGFSNFFVIPDLCVSLPPIRHRDGLPPVGLLLNAEEFDSLVQLYHPDRFERSLLDAIFSITSGYVSAAVDLLLVASGSETNKDSSAALITLDDFMQHHSLPDLIDSLDGNVESAFRRGLPSRNDLTDAPTAYVFRTILENHFVEMKDLAGSDLELPQRQNALRMCFEKGWFHNAEEGPGIFTRDIYFFASPLHRMIAENLLCSCNLNQAPNIADGSSLVELAIAVCRRLSRSNLSSTYDPIGPAGIRRSSTSRCGDEFYRECSRYTGGGIVSSEFGGKDGQLYIYIPSKKWGIAVVCDGGDGSEHSARFSPGGSYGRWISGGLMAESIVLNFCGGVPARGPQNLGVTNVYHVVTSLEDDDASVRIVNSQTNEVDVFDLAK
ncbi:hypothetical protein EST38_g2583 [Candolleomyces aberdarensis]|uniref:Uncharacterized protein n=1 Tax=Candolleomyces aberdarensis TaxID=2316362 RepID=A0A4Q2DSN8_9AGAR|nr:hypothetical protein EST38_g2583 [Candolleomyces aberdarensis]